MEISNFQQGAKLRRQNRLTSHNYLASKFEVNNVNFII